MLLLAPGAGAGPDLDSPAVRRLVEEWRREIHPSDQTLQQQRRALLESHLREARQMGERARTAGNISARAAARSLQEIFESALNDLDASRPLEIPDRVRRDVEVTVEEYRRQDRQAVEEHAKRLEQIEQEFLGRFQAVLQAAGAEPDAAALREAWHRVTRAATTPAVPDPGDPVSQPADPAPGDPAAPADPVPDASLPEPAPEPAAPPVPDVLAVSGDAAEWLPLGRIEVEVNAMEVFRIPLRGLNTDLELTGTGPISGQPYALRYIPLREWTPTDPVPPLRALPVVGQTPLDIIAWPSPRTRWHLEIRVRPRGNVPARHAARIEAAADIASAWPRTAAAQPDRRPAENGDPERGTDPAESPDPMVRVRILSEPPGAIVLLEDRVLMRGARAVTTPCDLRIPAETQRIRLRLRGYREFSFDAGPFEDGQTLQAVLEDDPDVIDQTITVAANARDWTMLPGRVREGQTVRILAQGRWACGARGEMIGPEGYPNDERFYHYYTGARSAPRQVSDANYGALLVRIGRTGPPRPVGEMLTFQADDSGFLYFDINEQPDPAQRRNNQGSLTVRVQAMMLEQP